ncbi:MAG TPA: SusD/RagB family nutrient-binding outer membrane lipoprotein [Algoriphagus sp.]|nr:SusD/RagB family nutrient-binding outer membrane lipoprotein [Algoriphagus sp.]
MKTLKYKNLSIFLLVSMLVFSCMNLEELNINPNGVDPASGHPNLLLATVQTQLGQNVLNLGFGDLAGVMQHTQKDGWSSGHNDYDWGAQGQSWAPFYEALRTNDELLKKAEELNLPHHKALGLILKSNLFGLVADLWGDAPFSQALKGEQGGEDNLKPLYDSQRDIYMGILADLETANQLLASEAGTGGAIPATQDVYYQGDILKWRKFANSLSLRYLMRISNKEAALSKAGIEKIVGNPSQYPLILSSSDDARMSYIGASPADSWPSNTVYDKSTSGNYLRIKVCSTLIDALKRLGDPRIAVYAERIQTPLVVESTWADDRDEIIDGVRHVAQNIADDYETNWGEELNLASDYIGLPPSSPAGGAYNLNPDLAQGTFNPHCSQLNPMYKDAAGALLQSRLMTASEVHFILAEAALKGWAVGDQKMHYEAAIKTSFESWKISDAYDAYIKGGGKYNGTLAQLIEQKWISSWTAASEAWFDYRRTGLPQLTTGPYAKRQAIPLRFYYMRDEILLNTANANAAIEDLEQTPFAAPDPKNSAWSKTWLLQGTPYPY